MTRRDYELLAQLALGVWAIVFWIACETGGLIG
jgi:hypothetical protein